MHERLEPVRIAKGDCLETRLTEENPRSGNLGKSSLATLPDSKSPYKTSLPRGFSMMKQQKREPQFIGNGNRGIKQLKNRIAN
ncbi:hypothetical protein V6N13_146110 [Hibiscus sabdariffa]